MTRFTFRRERGADRGRDRIVVEAGANRLAGALLLPRDDADAFWQWLEDATVHSTLRHMKPAREGPGGEVIEFEAWAE